MWSKLYSNTGKLIYEGSFLDGYFQGKGILFYENGNKQLNCTFIKGLCEGEGESYYEKTGNIEYRGIFKNGKFNDLGYYYTEDGSSIFLCKHEEGKRKSCILIYKEPI